MERRLAAILAADVVGFSRLVGEDEEATLRTLGACRDVIDRLVTGHHGRVFGSAGDSVVAEFASPVEAVRCAADIQRDFERRNAEQPEDRRMRFRIGINLGDVVVEGDNLMGDGVNVAARLEALADAGGICLSQPVFDQIKQKLELGYEYLGEREVKNIAEPVRVYRVLLDPAAAGTVIGAAKPATQSWKWAALTAAAALVIGALAVVAWLRPWAPDVEPASVERMAFPLPDKPSIAVLPFDNLSGDPDQDYFVDGLTEDIIIELSRFTELFVIARTSTFSYRNKVATVAQVAEELGVRYVLEGSVRRTETDLLITIQLIDATSGAHLWAERYEKPVTEFRALEEEILHKIVSTVASRVEDVGLRIANRKHTNNLSAYELVLRGYALIEEYRKASNQQAKSNFEQAVELDPHYVRAHSGLAEAYLLEYVFGWSSDSSASLARARAATLEALALDNNDNRARSSLGWTHIYEGRIDQGIVEIEQALTLNPNDAQLLATASYALTYHGDFEAAARQVKRAMRLNPFHADFYYDVLGWAYYFLERYDDALQVTTRIANPNAGQHRLLAATYARLGRMDKARTHAEKALEIEPDFAVGIFAKNMPFKDPEKLDFYLEGLRMAGLPERPPLELPDKPSIAVLPFTNMSGDPEQEYFVDGMTEDLITDLSKISGLFVIARNSSFSYKGQQVKVRQVAEELGVRYVLEGSVRRAGDQVRINAQLIDATTGGHLWAERYDGTLDDIFALQDRVTEQIVAALAVSLTGAEQARQARHDTENAAAHDAYLQGWARYKLLTPATLAEAVPFFEESLRLDPAYGRAHAALASLYWEVLQNGWAFDLNMTSYRAEEFANKHLEEALKNPVPLAHAVQAKMFGAWGFYDDAVLEAEKAVALDRNDATALAGLADAMVLAGRPAEAINPIEKSIRLDPHHPPSYLITLGAARFGMKQYQIAAETFERAATLNPDNQVPLLYLASSYGYLGRIEDADDVIETANDLRSALGLGQLSIRPSEAFAAFPSDKYQINFRRFGSLSDQDHLRAGLTDIPALKWQYLVTVHRVLGPYNSSFDVDGATQIDIAAAKAFHDSGAIFIDVSADNIWNAGHIPGAVHLSWQRGGDPSRPRISKTTLLEVAGYDDEIVLYHYNSGAASPAWEVAKAITWGYRKVYFFDGGAKAWKEAGYPVETGP